MSEQELKQMHLEVFLSRIKRDGYGKDQESILCIYSTGIEAGFSIYKDMLLPELLFKSWEAGETFGANYVSPLYPKDHDGSKKSFEEWLKTTT